MHSKTGLDGESLWVRILQADSHCGLLRSSLGLIRIIGRDGQRALEGDAWEKSRLVGRGG